VGFVDKNNLLQELNGDVVLELGCGPKKKHADAIGIDALDYAGVDIVGDALEIIRAFPDESVSAVYTYHFLEHVDDVPLLLEELARVLRVGGALSIVVPHFSSPYYYSDITHRRFFGLYTMCYFSEGGGLRRRVPTYQREISYRLDAVKLVFKSSPPFYVRHGLKKLFEKLVNVSTYTKELYEEMFCYVIPCYEVHYQLRRIN
jgi:ubiquinone/menaquinone biosynthesis C-methylase UbiE